MILHNINLKLIILLVEIKNKLFPKITSTLLITDGKSSSKYAVGKAALCAQNSDTVKQQFACIGFNNIRLLKSQSCKVLYLEGSTERVRQLTNIMQHHRVPMKTNSKSTQLLSNGFSI